MMKVAPFACGCQKDFVSRLGDLSRKWLRSAERLFHMLVGIVFLVLTLAGASVSFSEWQFYQRSPSIGVVRLSLLAGFTVFLFFCALYSFLRARGVR